MISHFYLALMVSSGFLLSTVLLGRSATVFSRISYAMPLGLSVYLLCIIFAFAVNAPFWVGITLTGLIGAANCVLVHRMLARDGRTWHHPALHTIGLGLAAFVIMQGAGALFEPALSYDSFAQLIFASALHFPELRVDFLQGLASWGFVLISLHGLAEFFDHQIYVPGLHPLILLGCALLLYENTKLITRNCSARIRHWSGGVITLLWLSTYFTQFNGVYIHNQTISLLFVLAMLGCVSRYYLEAHAEKLLIGFILFALGFALCRMEAPVYLCAFLAGAFVTMRTLPARFSQAVLVIAGLISVWYILLFYGIGQGTEILTPFRVIIVLGGLAAISGLAWLHWFFTTSPLWTWGRFALFPALWAIVLVLCLLDPAAGMQNIRNLSINTTSSFWSYTWYLQFPLLGAMLIGLGLRKNRPELSPALNLWVFYLFFGTAMFVLVFAFGFVRIPYRLGWGDSGNRIATIILPVLLCASVAWCVWLSQKDPTKVKGSPQTGMLYLSCAMVIGAIFLAMLPIVSRYVPSANQATYARVIQADNLYPDFAFEQALDNSCGLDDTYTAARGSGPRTIVLELDRRPSISTISLCFYRKQHFTDFALLSSQNGETWDSLYDTQSPAGNMPTLNGNVWVLDGLKTGPIGFFKLEYRASQGQNRFLLRGLRLLK